VLQVRTSERDAVMHVLRDHGLSRHSHAIGKTRPAQGGHDHRVWARSRSGVTPARCLPPACRTCTRSGMRSAGRSASARQPRVRRRRTCGRRPTRGPGPACAPHVRAGHCATGTCTGPAPAARGRAARAGCQLACGDGVRVHPGRFRCLRRAHERPAHRPHPAGRFPGPGGLWRFQLRRHAGCRHRLGPLDHLQPAAGRPVPGFFARPTPLAWACAMAARCLPSWPTSFPAPGLAAFHDQPAASVSKRACRWSRCCSRPRCFWPAWPAAACRSPSPTARGLPTSATAVTRPG
jgi:hypothetical protein